MKFRCPYCKHVLGEEAIPICPQCKKAVKIPEHMKESMNKMKDEKAKDQAARLAASSASLTSDLLSANPPVIMMAVVLIVFIVAVVVALQKNTSGKNVAVEYIDPKTLVENACNVSTNMAKKELKSLRIAFEIYHRDSGNYPSAKEGLIALINNPGLETWKGPYVTFIRPDPWKHQYQYSVSNNVMRLFSLGADGIEGTSDDVTAPEPTDKDRTDYDLPLPLLPE